jgi:hypothetical protein
MVQKASTNTDKLGIRKGNFVGRNSKLQPFPDFAKLYIVADILRFQTFIFDDNTNVRTFIDEKVHFFKNIP